MVASRIVMHDDRVGQIKKYILVAKELQKVRQINRKINLFLRDISLPTLV